METINKLLKKQAPKTNRKAQLGDETPDGEHNIDSHSVLTQDCNNVSTYSCGKDTYVPHANRKM